MPTTTKGTFYRRKEMEQMWCFQCSCVLCRDPTEAGTMFSALKCPVCEEDVDGYLLPMDPLNPESTWRCKQCNFTQGINDSINQNCEMEQLLDSTFKKSQVDDDGDVPELRNLLLTLEEVLHTNHYLNIRLKQKLGVLLGKKEGCDDLGDISTDLIKIKLSLCEDVVKVKCKLERGFNGKWREIMDNEINRCHVELSKRVEK